MKMSKQDLKEYMDYFLGSSIGLYGGIIYHNPLLESDELSSKKITYQFDSPHYKTLLEKYNLIKIAGKGSEFEKMLRVMHAIAPKLIHSPNFDNSVPLNSLDLLDYALDKGNGINCLCKSKIFTEIALALGIYARRMWMMPYSPYDFDNHVIVEIYDKKYQKWIAIDPTSDIYYIDKDKTPLNLLEIRNLLSNNEFFTIIEKRNINKDIEELSKKFEYLYLNVYSAKNVFYFIVESFQGYGNDTPVENYYFIPKDFDVIKHRITNIQFRKKSITDQSIIKMYDDNIKKLNNSNQVIPVCISVLIQSPLNS